MKHAAFIAALALNGGKIKEAAEQTGTDYDYARQLVSRHPEIGEAIHQATETVQHTLRSWGDYMAEAQERLAKHMRSFDEDVSLKATIEMLNRVEGKPRQSVELKVEEKETGLTTVGMRAIAALLIHGRVSTYAEAAEWVERNPEAVEQWAAQNTGPTPEP